MRIHATFWALLAALSWFSAVSCQKPEKTTTIIRESPAQPSGVDVKVQGGQNGGVQVDVHGKTDK